MKVSVLIKAYNHERFIAAAIETAASQQTCFPFEVVVGEDCSTDGTRAAALAAAAKHPDKVRVLVRPRNLGNMANLLDTFRHCRGEYIAWLDGDDYWVARDKLARQVQLLNANPRFVISATNAAVVDTAGNVVRPHYKRTGNRIFQLRHLMQRGRAPTSSLLIRRRVFEELPANFAEFAIADWPLQILGLRHGAMHYDGTVTTAYRRHGGGLWAAADLTKRHQTQLRMYRLLAEHLPSHYRTIRARIGREQLLLARALAQAGDRTQAGRALREGLRKGRHSPAVWLRWLRVAWEVGKARDSVRAR